MKLDFFDSGLSFDNMVPIHESVHNALLECCVRQIYSQCITRRIIDALREDNTCVIHLCDNHDIHVKIIPFQGEKVVLTEKNRHNRPIIIYEYEDGIHEEEVLEAVYYFLYCAAEYRYVEYYCNYNGAQNPPIEECYDKALKEQQKSTGIRLLVADCYCYYIQEEMDKIVSQLIDSLKSNNDGDWYLAYSRSKCAIVINEMEHAIIDCNINQDEEKYIPYLELYQLNISSFKEQCKYVYYQLRMKVVNAIVNHIMQHDNGSYINSSNISLEYIRNKMNLDTTEIWKTYRDLAKYICTKTDYDFRNDVYILKQVEEDEQDIRNCAKMILFAHEDENFQLNHSVFRGMDWYEHLKEDEGLVRKVFKICKKEGIDRYALYIEKYGYQADTFLDELYIAYCMICHLAIYNHLRREIICQINI